MQTEIRTEELNLLVSGFGSVAAGNDSTATAFRLSGKMWEIVKSRTLANQGKNIWIYDSGHQVFAGVELADASAGTAAGLESKQLQLKKYAYYKHTGPYRLIRESGEKMRAELKQQGFEVILPYVEMYGHWNADESKLETELFMNLR